MKSHFEISKMQSYSTVWKHAAVKFRGGNFYLKKQKHLYVDSTYWLFKSDAREITLLRVGLLYPRIYEKTTVRRGSSGDATLPLKYQGIFCSLKCETMCLQQ